MTLSTLVVIVYSTPIFGVVIVPILILYWFVQVNLSLSCILSMSSENALCHAGDISNVHDLLQGHGFTTTFFRLLYEVYVLAELTFSFDMGCRYCKKNVLHDLTYCMYKANKDQIIPLSRINKCYFCIKAANFLRNRYL